jgi:hypothetical protein
MIDWRFVLPTKRSFHCRLTAHQFRYFSVIRPSELFDLAWQKPNSAELAPNITSLTRKYGAFWTRSFLGVC